MSIFWRIFALACLISCELAGAWSTGSSVSGLSNTALARLAKDDLGTLHAVWVTADSFVNLYHSSMPLEGSWATPTQLSTAGMNVRAFSFKVDSSGNAVAVWRSLTTIYAATKPVSGSWTAPVTLSNTLRIGLDPQVIFSSTGVASATWTEFDGTNYSVQNSSFTF